MATVTDLRIGVAPRKRKDDVRLIFTGNLNLTEDDVTTLEGRLATGLIQVKDRDPGRDDVVQNDNFFELQSSDVGANPFTVEVFITRKKVKDSEPGIEGGAELYGRVRGVVPRTPLVDSPELTVDV